MREFFTELARFVPADARVMYCGFRGDPNDDAEPGRWRARVLNNPDALDPLANLYVCVSAMRRNARGEFRRRKENFAGGLCLMIDDLGTGRGAKQPLATIERLPPTALIETSPGNFQAVYMFDRLETDMAQFDALIRAFVAGCLLEPKNSGMEGVNRVFRPPAGINGKAKYRADTRDGRDWRVRLEEFVAERRYSIPDIAKAFALTLTPERPKPRDAAILLGEKGERIRAFIATRAVLRGAGMLKREEPNYSGWIDITCPWVGNHTDGADNGASIREPAEENEWFGAFRCHHGGCAGRGWRDVTEWLAEEAAEIIDEVNAGAGEWSAYRLGEPR